MPFPDETKPLEELSLVDIAYEFHELSVDKCSQTDEMTQSAAIFYGPLWFAPIGPFLMTNHKIRQEKFLQMLTMAISP